MKKEGLIHKQGFVLLLDCLGASLFSREESEKYFGLVNDFLQIAAQAHEDELAAYLFSLGKNPENYRHEDVDDDPDEDPEEKQLYRVARLPQPNMFLFGDTVLFTWEVDSLANAVKRDIVRIRYFQAFNTASQIIRKSIDRHVYFRGVVSIGEYFENKDGNIVLGPAIADAARWYEQFKLIGVFSTPHLTRRINSLYPFFRVSPIAYPFLYRAPVKKGGRMETYAADWVYSILFKESEFDPILSTALDGLVPVSPETAGSEYYANTERFIVDYFVSKKQWMDQVSNSKATTRPTYLPVLGRAIEEAQAYLDAISEDKGDQLR